MATTARKRPSKPSRDFPLFAHRNGQWCKKVKGKLCYFGTFDAGPDKALKKWLEQRDDLLAGRVPRTKGGQLTVKDCCERFITAKRILVDSGELSIRTWADSHAACKRVLNAFGPARPVVDLAADDFGALRATLAKTLNAVSLKVELQRIRTVFKFAYDSGMIDRPVRFGPLFKPPSRLVLQKDRLSKGSRVFEADEIRQMIKAAPTQLRAMILLGINCGYGNHDCATLPQSAISDGWVVFARPKTGIERRCPLWPETVEAIQAAIAARPAPAIPADGGLVFLTPRGLRWVRINGDKDADSVGPVMVKLLSGLGIRKPGLGFCGLRHSHRTAADGAKDQPAANFIMGHADGTMAAIYRERIDDDRLVTVTDHVHAWLFGDEKTD